MRRLPSDIVNLANSLGGEFGDSRSEQNVSTAGLQRHDLQIHGRIGGFIRLRSHHQFIRLITKPFPQTFEVILAEIVVLIEHCNLGIGQILENVVGINAHSTR